MAFYSQPAIVELYKQFHITDGEHGGIFFDPELNSIEHSDALRTMLARIPLPDRVRIVDNLRRIGTEYGYALSDPRWWTIDAKKNTLFVTLTDSNGFSFTVTLCWSMARKGKNRPTPSTDAASSIVYDIEDSNRWRIEVSCDEYKRAIASFRAILSQPADLIGRLKLTIADSTERPQRVANA